MLKDLRFGVYRFLMRAKEPLLLPEFKGGVLRGAFGTVFKKMACSRYQGPAVVVTEPEIASCSRKDTSPEPGIEETRWEGPEEAEEDRSEAVSTRRDKPCLDCPAAVGCVYKAIFEPSPPPGSERLRTLEDIPRPFVLRIPPDPRRILNTGELLIWEVVLVGNAIGALPYFIVAFKEIGEIGFGLWHDGRRSKAHLEAVHSVNPFTHSASRIYSGTTSTVDLSRHIEITGEDIMAEAKKLPDDFIMVEFRTPTRMRYQSRYVEIPEFHVLVRNLLRRLSTLSYFYEGKEINLDFEGLISRASKVTLDASDLAWKPWLRYSGRSKTRMDFGGFMGKVWYKGHLEEFLPLLVYGTLSNVGKTATFGLGQYVLGHPSKA